VPGENSKPLIQSDPMPSVSRRDECPTRFATQSLVGQWVGSIVQFSYKKALPIANS